MPDALELGPTTSPCQSRDLARQNVQCLPLRGQGRGRARAPRWCGDGADRGAGGAAFTSKPGLEDGPYVSTVEGYPRWRPNQRNIC